MKLDGSVIVSLFGDLPIEKYPIHCFEILERRLMELDLTFKPGDSSQGVLVGK